MGGIVSRNMGNNSVIDDKDGKGKRKWAKEEGCKGTKGPETLKLMRKRNFTYPEVHVG